MPQIAVEMGEITLEEAYRRNVALPSRDKVFPPDLAAAARRAVRRRGDRATA